MFKLLFKVIQAREGAPSYYTAQLCSVLVMSGLDLVLLSLQNLREGRTA